MSGIAGVYLYSQDGRSSEHTLLWMADSLRHLGPDGRSLASSGPVGMAYTAFHTTPESRIEIQPLKAANGNIVAWDGRLDNREDFLPDFGAPDRTDVSIVLNVYQRYGFSFLGKLIGDFALALWDSHRRELVLARDGLGMRPLFYCITPAGILWASAIVALLRATELPRTLDDDYVADSLVRYPPPDGTPLKAVRSVPAGGWLLAAGASVSLGSYWRAEPGPEVRYGTDADYEAHFSELFRASVGSRLRAEAAVCSELSGGLDSTSIVSMADDIMRAGECPQLNLTTLSYVFDESPTSDERCFIRYAEEARQRAGRHFTEQEQQILSIAEWPPSVLPNSPTPDLCFLQRHLSVYRFMRNLGSRVLLRGIGGDQLLWGEVDIPLEPADHLGRFHFREAQRSVRTWSRHLREPYFRLAWASAIWPLLPLKVRCRCWPAARPAPWLAKPFARRMDLRRRALGRHPAGASLLPSSSQECVYVEDMIGNASWGYYVDSACVEVRHPFLDRRLVEFCLAIPHEQKLRAGQTRSLLRRALRDLLPPAIAQRTSKAGPTEAVFRALISQWPTLRSLFRDARVYGFGYVDAPALLKSLERARHGVVSNAPGLVRVIALELWLRCLEHSESLRVNRQDALELQHDSEAAMLGVRSAAIGRR